MVVCKFHGTLSKPWNKKAWWENETLTRFTTYTEIFGHVEQRSEQATGRVIRQTALRHLAHSTIDEKTEQGGTQNVRLTSTPIPSFLKELFPVILKRTADITGFCRDVDTNYALLGY